MRIGKFSVNNSVMVNILMLALLALGAITLLRMPQEQFSEVPFYFAVISVPLAGCVRRRSGTASTYTY